MIKRIFRFRIEARDADPRLKRPRWRHVTKTATREEAETLIASFRQLRSPRDYRIKPA